MTGIEYLGCAAAPLSAVHLDEHCRYSTDGDSHEMLTQDVYLAR